jgi:hypothetical protein
MTRPFFGRERELELLDELLEKNVASLVVLKGRRRIGKSRLIEEFSSTLKSFLFEGLPPKNEEITAEDQRLHFAKELERETGARGLKTEDWDDLLWHLAQHTKRGRILIILDEINWMGSKDPTFLGKLKTAWDRYFKKNPKLILILSGSMSSWIEENILSSTGFLGRVSLNITLEELPLYECNHFWGRSEHRISSFEKFKILSVTGGVPRYLEEIDPKIPAEQMIHRLCFRPEGLLFQEFERIFSDLFSRRAETYKKIVFQLAKGHASLKEIQTALKLGKGGMLSDYLDDLVTTQYIERKHAWDLRSGAPSKASIFRLKDNYLRFYLKYIEPNRSAILKRTLAHPPAWDAIMGLQFENLVLSNFHSLFAKMKIPLNELVNDGPFFQKRTKGKKGCQIDYLIQTKYHNLYVCEIKFSKDLIGPDVIEEVQEKMYRLHIPKTPFSYRPVLIHVNGVQKSVQYSNFFTHIIDFSELLYLL